MTPGIAELSVFGTRLHPVVALSLGLSCRFRPRLGFGGLGFSVQVLPKHSKESKNLAPDVSLKAALSSRLR